VTMIAGLFGEMNFSEMKEADVREDIITPLLKRIGYGIAGAKISRAHRLKHPFLKYGHRETPIQAEADYLLEVDGNIVGYSKLNHRNQYLMKTFVKRIAIPFIMK
jgi:hypothetical protein